MSKIDIGLKNPFRFYTGKRFQERRQRWMKNANDVFKLVSADDRFLPFQLIKKTASPFIFTSFKIYDWNSGSLIYSTNDIFDLIFEDDISVYTFQETEYIVYFGNLGFKNGYSLNKGQYYIEAESGDDEVFASEIFTVYKNVIDGVRPVSILPPSSSNDDYTDKIRKYKISGRMDWGASGRLEVKFSGETFYFRQFSQNPGVDFLTIYDWISSSIDYNVGAPNNDEIIVEVAAFELQSVKYIYDGPGNNFIDFPVTYLSQRQDEVYWYQKDGISEIFINTEDCAVTIDGVLRAKKENNFSQYRSYSESVTVYRNGVASNKDISVFPKDVMIKVEDDYFAFGTDNSEVLRYKKIAQAKIVSNGCFSLIEYCNCSPIGQILYGNNYQYKNRIYLDFELGDPEYKKEQIGFDDGNKIFHATFQSLKKEYRMNLVLPEFMVDAFTLLSLHDIVYLKMPYKEDVRIRDIEVDPKWKGAFAEVEIEFRENVVVRNGGCDPVNEKTYRQLYAMDVLCTVVLNDIEYTQGRYSKDYDNIFTPFEQDNLILVFDDSTQTTGGIYRIERSGSNYSYVFENQYQVEKKLIYSIRENKYRIFVGTPFEVWSDVPFIKSKIANTTGQQYWEVKGVIFPNTFSELYYNDFTPNSPNYLKISNEPLLQDEVLNNGFISAFTGFGRYFKISSKNHSENFGLSEYK